ncbi:MAG TPA: hypothetical protein VGF72_01705 [Gaiellaceae bacterium]
MSITTGYIIAGAFEVVGVVWVVVDVYFDRRRARGIAARRSGLPSRPRGRGLIYEDIASDEIARHPTSATSYRILKRRRTSLSNEIQRGARRAALVEAEVLNMLRGNLVRRLGGPACLVVGIVVGTVANIANTH